MPHSQHTAPVLRLPYRGAPQTVAVIANGALKAQNHLNVRLLAEEITQGIANKDYLSEILAIYYWVLPPARLRYINDPRTVELVRDPHVVVDELRAGKRPGLDCDDLVALLCALLLAIGREVQIVTVALQHMFVRGERQYSHVYCRAREPQGRKWIVLDPVAAEDTAKMLRRAVAIKYWPLA